MAHVDRSCIDRWEAHLVLRAADGGVASHPHYHRPTNGARYEARSAPGAFPQGYLTRAQSAAACEAAGKRLCTLSEWRRACQSSQRHAFPYGPREKPGACNSGKGHLLMQLFGSDMMRWEYEKHFNSPLLLQEPGFLAKAGEHRECAAEGGIHDLVGNLNEWVSDTATRELVERLRRDNVYRKEQKQWRSGNGVFVGGFFSTKNQLGPGCYYTTIAHEPAFHDYTTGFRCCKQAGR
jgi:formylglycine-generating enzyme required for sulfatase activity